LEIHVIAGARAAVFAIALMLAAAPALHAQGRYRVAIGVVGQPKPIVAEFRVCVPAETSDCGSWIVRDGSVDDSSVITIPVEIRQLRSPNGADSISIVGDAVVIRSLTPGATPSRNAIREKTFIPRAIAVAPDSRYLFVVFESASGESSVIDMIELKSMAVTDALAVRAHSTGIAILR
jgi:hypothetical protein